MKNEKTANPIKEIKEATKEVKKESNKLDKKAKADPVVPATTSKSPISPPIPFVPKEDDSSYSLKTAELSFNTEVYDEGDIASALELGFIAHALEMHKAKVAPERHPDFDGESCLDCGDEIPKARLVMGRIRCVHCQEILEKKNKLRG